MRKNAPQRRFVTQTDVDYRSKFDTKVKDSLAMEFLFNTHPRLFSFSHRPLVSLRHPRSAYLQWQDEIGPQVLQQLQAQLITTQQQARRARRASVAAADRPTTKMDRICLSHNAVYREDEEFLWVELGHMFDNVCFEAELDSRRQAVLEAWPVQRQLEIWWSFFCPTQGARFVSRETYSALQRVLCCILFQIPSEDLPQNVLEELTDNDFCVDVAHSDSCSSGVEGVDFAAFSLSLLELVDTWNRAKGDADSTVQYLQNLFEEVSLWFAEPEKKPRKTVSEKKAEWDETKSAIVLSVECMEPPFPSISCEYDSATGKPVYVKHE